MALPEEFLYQLKQANPIENVVSSYVDLKRRGRTFVCLCPFHSERSPSCTIYPETDSFYCYGCGAGGDAITFIRKIENLEYMEAIRLLADRAGISVPENNVGQDIIKLKARILSMNRDAARFFHKQLSQPVGRKCLEYFANRGLKAETIQKYGLGYAPEGWDFKNHMNSLGYSDEELVKASLCKQNAQGRVYAAFRNRAMFPLIDLRGNVIAFGGRILGGDGPKYLNSGDTPVFNKRRNLFSLNFAKNSPIKTLILAEGYMDVISINQAGFENVVATLGTALTPEQARLMAQYAEQVIIAYDSDGAGQEATQRAINLLDSAGISTKIIKMEGAKDPDEYIKKFGAIRFKLLLQNSGDAMSFELEKCKQNFDMETELGKREYLKKAVVVISKFNSELDREVYISKVADECKISRDAVKTSVESIISKRRRSNEKKEWVAITTASKIPDKINPDAVKFPREAKAEEGIISYILKHNDALEDILQRISPEEFVTEFNRRVFKSIAEKMKKEVDFSITLLNEEFSPDEMGKISEMLRKNDELQIDEMTACEFVNAIKNREDTIVTSGNMSDDDLMEIRKRILNKKGISSYGGQKNGNK